MQWLYRRPPESQGLLDTVASGPQARNQSPGSYYDLLSGTAWLWPKPAIWLLRRATFKETRNAGAVVWGAKDHIS